MQYVLIGLWIAIVAVQIGCYLATGIFPTVFYDTVHLGWTIRNMTMYQSMFNVYYWTVTKWGSVAIACMFYVLSFIKLRWFKAQQFDQQQNAQKNIEFRLLVLCAINTVIKYYQ